MSGVQVPSGQYQQQSATAKALAFARSVTVPGLMAGITVVGLQAAMPEGRRPSDFLGAFHGSTHGSMLRTQRQDEVDSAYQIGAASEAPRQQQQAILDSLEMKKQAANLADAACMSAGIATALFGRDAADYANAAKLACGESTKLRREIVEDQIEASRLGAILLHQSVTSGLSVSPPS